METARGTYGGTLTVEVAGVPYPLEFGDWVDDRLWSTCQFATTQQTTLQTLIGAPGDPMPGNTSATLSKRESNLPRGAGAGLPDGYEMLVFSIQHVMGSNMNDLPAGLTLADISDIFDRTVFSFLVQNKVKNMGPLYKHPAGSGGYGRTDASAQVNNGVPSPRDQAAFVLPIELRPNVSFRGEFEFDAALSLASAVQIETHLQGLYKRPVT